MEWQRSRYLIFGSQQYCVPGMAGSEPQRVAYFTKKAKVLTFPASVADALEHNDLQALNFQETARLVEAGVLVEKVSDERAEVVDLQRNAAHDPSHHTFVLVPTSYCNMGCDYCGQSHSKAAYAPEHRVAVEQRICAAIRDRRTEAVNVRWFGGEPTMAWATMRELSKKFVDASDLAGKQYAASIITNGSLLTPKKLHEMHDDFKIRDMCVTLDGIDGTHDQNRPLKSGQSSFGRIIKWLQYLTQNAEDFPNLRVNIRTNVDIRNKDAVGFFIERMASLGFSSKKIYFSIAAVYAWSNDVSSIRLERTEFAQAELEWLKLMASHNLDVQLLPGALRTALCPAVSSNEEVLSSTGAVFSCTEHPLVDVHEAQDVLARVVDLQWPKLRPAGAYADWHDRIESDSQPCSQCPFLPVCGGACPKHWAEGDPPCPSYKYAVDGRLDIVAKQNGLVSVLTGTTVQ